MSNLHSELPTTHLPKLGADLGVAIPDSGSDVARKDAPNLGKTTTEGQVGRHLKSLWQDLKGSPRAGRIALLFLVLLGTLAINVGGEIVLNRWQGGLFSALEKRNLGLVLHQSLFILLLMGFLLALVVLQFWTLERLKVRFRQWLTHVLLDLWFQPRFAYQLNISVPHLDGENLRPDQRIQDDMKNLTDISGELGIGLIGSVLRLVCFIGVLWGLSSGVVFQAWGHTATVPGYLVWIAIIYAVLGTWMAGRVGRPLIQLNEGRYAAEAELRSALRRVEENAESIAFYRGETDERRRVNLKFESVLETLRSMSWAHARLTWVATGHGYTAFLLPIIAALPAFLQGRLDFGGLMMVIGAFNQVQTALRWFVDHYHRIADWRAVLTRVVSFYECLRTNSIEVEKRIERQLHPTGSLSVTSASVELHNGKVLINEVSLEIAAGERVFVTGESGTGKSTFLRVLGGLWPWGRGSVQIPDVNEMMFLPQRPYLPTGSLAAAVAYPKAADAFTTEELTACLVKVNLGEFASSLQIESHWELQLSLGQQQRLAFARLLLHRPKWIFLDEATSALDDDNQDRVMSVFTEELVSSAVISVGHRTNLERFHDRVLNLEKTNLGAEMRHGAQKREVRPSALYPENRVTPVA